MNIQEPEDKRPGLYTAVAVSVHTQGINVDITCETLHCLFYDGYNAQAQAEVITRAEKTTTYPIIKIIIFRIDNGLVRSAATLLDPPKPEAPMLSQKVGNS